MNGVAFMVPYWSTFAVVAALTIIAWIAAGAASEEGARSRTIRNFVVVAVALTCVTLPALIVGFWLPFVVPGLY